MGRVVSPGHCRTGARRRLGRRSLETEVVGRYKNVFWAPGDHAFRGEPLANVVGRPEGFRYRWEDKRVWDQLAHDMIVVSCG